MKTGKKTIALILVYLLITGILPGAIVAAEGFSDVASDHWAYGVITKWSGGSYGILVGDGDGTFAPSREMTLGELSAVLSRIFNYTERVSANVTPDWAKGAVEAVMAAGILPKSDYVDASVTVTREQAIRYIALAYHIEQVQGQTSFADDEDIGAEYKPYVNAFQKLGYIVGKPGNLFDPKAGYTRAEAMAVLDNTTGDILDTSVEGKTYTKTIVIRKSGVSLKNCSIDQAFINANNVIISGSGSVKNIYVGANAKSGVEVLTVPTKVTVNANAGAVKTPSGTIQPGTTATTSYPAGGAGGGGGASGGGSSGGGGGGDNPDPPGGGGSSGLFNFDLSQSVYSNRFSLSGTITGDNELSHVLYQVFTGAASAFNEADFLVAEYAIGAMTASISITDIMTAEGTNYVRIYVEDIYGNHDMAIYSLFNDFGIFEAPAPDPSAIVEDTLSGIMYVPGRAFLWFDSDNTTLAAAQSFITDTLNGEILGYDYEDLSFVVLFTTAGDEFGTFEDFQLFLDQLVTDYEASDHLWFATVDSIVEYEIMATLNNDCVEVNDPGWADGFALDNSSGTMQLGWGLETINAQKAWAKNYFMQRTIPIGIYDDGFNAEHPDLKGRINNVLSNTGSPKDHGTSVAGIIGAIPDNDIGITGIAWSTKMHVASGTDTSYGLEVVLGANFANFFSGQKNALKSLLANGVKVINISAGPSYRRGYLDYTSMLTERAMYNNLMYALTKSYGDFLIVYAAGNDGDKTQNFLQPNIGLAEYAGAFAGANDYKQRIIVVGAAIKLANGTLRLKHESNYGSRIDVLAPGYLNRTTRAYDYWFFGDTSGAAPHVTGVAAMLFAANPMLTASQVKEILVSTADIPVIIPVEKTGTFSNMINAEKALDMAISMRNLYPSMTGIVNGKIINSDSNPNSGIEGATVSFRYDNGIANDTTVFTTTTSASGAYSIQLPPGTFRVFAYKDGYSDYDSYVINPYEDNVNPFVNMRGKVNVRHGGKEKFDVVLKPDTIGGGGDPGPDDGDFLEPITPPVSGSIPISNRAQLEAISGNLSGNYHLTQDIDLSGAEWTPLGLGQFSGALEALSQFTGTFDGQGHVIKNMKITGTFTSAYPIEMGLFRYAEGATIKNVGLVGTQIDINYTSPGSISVGGICGAAFNTVIDNCYNTGSIYVLATNAIADAGGIFGIGSAAISNCYNTGDITAHSDSTNQGASAGGICALNDSPISNSYNTGDVSASCSSESMSNAGGISGTSWASVDRCHNTGDVAAYSGDDFASAGGICSVLASSDFEITNCYNLGNISALSDSYFENRARAGGICEWSLGYIRNCYSTGVILAYYLNMGGICSKADIVNSVVNSYCMDLYGSSNGTQLSPAQMQIAASFVGFDFAGVWDISPSKNDGFPFLR